MILLRHPLIFALSLFLQTLMVCALLSKLSLWLSLILFLVFLGGILVIFIYVTSLRANEQFFFDLSSLLWLIPLLAPLAFHLTTVAPLPMSSITSPRDSIPFLIGVNLSSLATPMYLFLVIYLFLALFLVIDFLNMNKKPLRSIV